jgi:hypothetical protein
MSSTVRLHRSLLTPPTPGAVLVLDRFVEVLDNCQMARPTARR